MYFAVFALLCTMVFLMSPGCADGGSRQAERQPSRSEPKKTYALMETSEGTMKIELFTTDAPGTCENFVKLARKGFYDGLTFHRIVKGFVIQGGCPNGDGTGGPGWTIPLEKSGRKHLEGSVAMARTRDPDSAGSQFYICCAPQPRLDGNYCVFGRVVEGLDVVHKIENIEVEKVVRGGVDMSRPARPVLIKRVRIVEE